jgi:hypothetical protein
MTMADPVRKVPPHGAWLWRLKLSGDGSESGSRTGKT